jgi:phosphatidylserine/phosphatidylglycerophosphate/cardiolipin synthase-like enzyme
MALNDEATLMVLDPTVGEQMNRIFLDDLRYAEEITPVVFGRRPWFSGSQSGDPTSSRACCEEAALDSHGS